MEGLKIWPRSKLFQKVNTKEVHEELCIVIRTNLNKLTYCGRRIGLNINGKEPLITFGAQNALKARITFYERYQGEHFS